MQRTAARKGERKVKITDTSTIIKYAKLVIQLMYGYPNWPFALRASIQNEATERITMPAHLNQKVLTLPMPAKTKRAGIGRMNELQADAIVQSDSRA